MRNFITESKQINHLKNLSAMQTKVINIYQFNELSEESKANAIFNYYESNSYSFLADDLDSSARELLRMKGCEYENFELFFSLSYCQGDGLCFTGEIKKDGKIMRLTHSHRYYFASSVNMEFFNEEWEEIDEVEELKNIYFEICDQLENEGYSIIEYRMNNEEFEELAEANNWQFLENGEME